MSTLTQWQFILALLIASSCRVVESKVFERCELAKVLRQRHRLDLTEVAQWVCIAQHSSGFNTAAQASSPSGGSHGLFQISDVYWCSPPGKGAGCNLPCHKLRDDNLSDDLSCIKRIYEEHQRISGDGYTAWIAYQQYCKNNAASYIQDCFPGERAQSTYLAPAKGYNSYHAPFAGNSIQDYSAKKSGKVYARCELAQELYLKHKMPMQQIPTWVCIAEHESRFNTAAVGRLNADGSADHGLFQISDLYWCSNDRGGKGCGLSCSKLLDNDITDDVRCIKRIHNEHTAISGDGFNAWSVYRPYCQNQRYEHIANCFKNAPQTTHHKVQTTTAVALSSNQVHSTTKYSFNNNPFLKNVIQQTPSKTHYTTSSYNDIYKAPTSSSAHRGSVSHKGKIYTRCSLAQELFSKHNFPLQDISTWVCIAEHESQFNTAAIGRLNTDGSADHGLFQISDKYWCEHSAYGGKACNLPCDKLLDDDLRDDVACIRTIHEEHTRISGDGFNAWTVYRPHCLNQNVEHIKSCFDAQTLAAVEVMEHAPSYNVPVSKGKGKIYSKCELAQELYHKHRMPMEQIPKWVCIAQHESSYNTAAVGRLNTDGSADHGLFQISDLYWCSHDQYGGKACNIPCHKLLDSDITDDVKCIKIIHEEHTRISGDGFNAWTVYQPHCRNIGMDHIKQCFSEQELKKVSSKLPSYNTNSLVPQSSVGTKPAAKGKIYKKCELAQELYHKHRMPMEQIPKWVCIAQHESSYNTAAVGRLNTDGSADHGLFQISDLYWCSHDQYGGKACNIPCDKLLDSDITDDVRCIKIIHEEHTRISGDGFNAWTVYKPHCRNIAISHVKECFTDKELKQVQTTGASNSLIPQSSFDSKPAPKGKIYKKCELAQELYHKHRMPMEQIPKWVCIAQHESSYNTAAVGRLNTDGSADHGLFQISDLYWCSHDQYGGKACNIPCSKLLDSDITDDVRCIKIIYDEHTRISGDGFNAWTVYKPHCRNIAISHVKECFTDKELNSVQTSVTNNALIPQSSFNSKPAPKGKIYKKCELAQELYHKHRLPMEQIPKWVCIAQHESSYNTAAVGRLNTDGSADHGLFQISDLYWCSHDQYGGKACNIPCDKLLDSDITDDVRCIKIIHEEHTRISGDGFNAWTVYKPHCRNIAISHVKECFTDKELNQVQATVASNALIPQSSFDSKPAPKGKIYKKCELAQELYHKHRMPMEQIPKWVCIAQHESSYNTAAVGRLNTDGSADHGLFQISDLYWCSHDQYGGKACNIPCDKLLDSDITDDVRCIKIIHEEHTRISGDGFNAWTVYKPHCRNTGMNHIKDCFTEKELKEANIPSTAVVANSIDTYYSPATKNVPKGKIYKKCELAQELLSKHKMPMEQIPTWVCIAQHESSFNTAAVGRLNADGSLDHGLFQISDLYWCSHDQYGGKACNIPCDKLLDSDITDDVKCIKIIHDEHTRISGDGFNAWTVYKPHCRNRKMEEIRSCFTPNQIEEFDKKQTYSSKPYKIATTQQQLASTSYSHNPFLSGAFKTQTVQSTRKPASNQDFKLPSNNDQPNYANNPFLQNIKVTSGSEVHKMVVPSSFPNQQLEVTAKPNYKDNPFLNGAFSSSSSSNIISKPVGLINELDSFKNNPFLSASIKLSTTAKPTKSSLQNNPFLQTTPAYRLEVTKNYLNSNDFRTTTTSKPKTTAAKPSTTTRKPTTSWNNYKTAITTTTKKPTTTSWTTTKKPTTSWNSYGATKTTTTTKPTTTTTRKTTTNKTTAARTTTTKKPATTTTTTRRPTTTTVKKPTTTTTKLPKTTTTWSWQNQKSTTKVPKATTTWNWQNQKYQSFTTTKPPRTTTTTRNWQNQKYTYNATLSQATTNWNVVKEQTTKSAKSTTIKPERTTWNWRNEQKSTTPKPITTTENWRKWDKTTTRSTTKKPIATTTTTRKTTQKTTTTKPTTNRTTTTRPTTNRTTKITTSRPTTDRTTKTSTTRPTTARTTKTTTTKPTHLENYKFTTTKPQTTRPYYTVQNNLKTTTLRPRSTTIKSALQKASFTTTTTTTTRKPLTTKSLTNTDYNNYKKDPFSHPFFTKVNEEFKKLQSNIATTKRPTFSATKLPSFSQSSLYQDFKNNTLNKTKTIVAYNFEGSKLTTTKRPRF